ncbi:hypothetical protein STRDD11_01497 [Streptococcus sp. DD11]|nr:hypothetical protein STRDD11_01497 [Streptococcus sp. DD11]
MGKLIEILFQRVYMAMMASAVFWLLALCGGLVLGLAPAGTVLMTLFQQYRYDYKEYHWREAWSLFKENFISANQVFYSFFLAEGLLLYGIYLLVQLPRQSIFYLLLTILNLLFLLAAPLAYAVYLKLQVYFELSYKNRIKLSLIGIFLTISAMLKLSLGTALLLLAGYYMPALLFLYLSVSGIFCQ